GCWRGRWRLSRCCRCRRRRCRRLGRWCRCRRLRSWSLFRFLLGPSRSRQRRRVVVLRAQEGDDVGALLRIWNAWEGHHRPRRKDLGISDPRVEQLVSPHPVLLMSLERRRIIEAFDRGDVPPDHAIEIRPNQHGAALIEGMADFAQSCVGLALLRVCRCEQLVDLSAATGRGCRLSAFGGLLLRATGCSASRRCPCPPLTLFLRSSP